jgi:hypothetical protein
MVVTFSHSPLCPLPDPFDTVSARCGTVPRGIAIIPLARVHREGRPPSPPISPLAAVSHRPPNPWQSPSMPPLYSFTTPQSVENSPLRWASTPHPFGVTLSISSDGKYPRGGAADPCPPPTRPVSFPRCLFFRVPSPSRPVFCEHATDSLPCGGQSERKDACL